MKKKRVLFIGLAVVLVAVTAFCLINRKKTSETINVGVRTDITDWAYYDEENGNCYGIEADISDLIAEKTGYEVNYVPVYEDGCEMLRQGEIDCLVFKYASEEFSDDILFSKEYYMSYPYIVVKNSSLITTTDELAGKPVGVLSYQSVPKQQLLTYMSEAGLEAPEFYTVDDYHMFKEYLETGEISAICATDDIGYSLVEDDSSILEEVLGKQYASLAVLKDNPKGKIILDAMNALIEDGTIEALLDSWGWTV
ncbi:MAG: transporter substrate-binding domain-containing protein [Lachnospiraceae bacterium]|nr:transporter substrate-binding domain-containing protein [Lachnospiraceae bacterium]